MNFIFSLLILTLASTPAWARKFSLEQRHVAPYFKGSWNSSTIGKDAFKDANGNATGISEEVQYQYSGEFGLFLLSKSFGVRIGVLGVYPQILDNVEGKNSAGALQYNLSSSIYGVFGVIHLEYNMLFTPSSRMYFSVGGGIGSVTVLNHYKFVNANTYSLGDFTEELRAYPPVFEGALGFEFLLLDNVTMFMDAGYRHLLVTDLRHQRDFSGFNSTTIHKGDEARDVNNKRREINMGAAFVGLGFKFYIN